MKIFTTLSLIPTYTTAFFVQQNYDIASTRRPSFTTSTTSLYMGWGPDPIWSKAKVLDCKKASSNSVSISVEVPEDTSTAYTIPGQYLQMKENDDGKPLFLAIASPPSSSEDAPNVLEFLIKETDGNEWVTSATNAKELQISQVLGNGYAIKENFEGFKYDFPVQNIIMCATGSGIAPIRSAIESSALQFKESGRSARLYYGCRSFEEMAYVDKFEEWEELGVEVVPILSQPTSDKWGGRTGYVQTAIEEDGILVPRNSGALVCGVKGMTEAVKEDLMKAGIFEGRILFNF